MLMSWITGMVLSFAGSIPLLGPIAIVAMRRGLEGRYRSALIFVAGGALAEGTYAYLAAQGVSAWVSDVPFFEPISLTIAVLVLGYIAFDLVRRSRKPLETDRKRVRSDESSFASGLVIAGINPGPLAAWAGIVAILATQGLGTIHGAAFGVGVIMGKIAWYALLMRAMKRYQSKLQEGWAGHLMAVTGVLAGCIAVWCIVQLGGTLGVSIV